MASKTFHVAMFPWFAIGHLTPYLHISNRLAERGHRISFFIPTNTKPKLEHLNLHPDLIHFISVTVPHVDGLPPGGETTADVPFALHPFLLTAFDLTEPTIEASLKDLKPQFVFFDLAHWMPALAQRLGIKAITYIIISPTTPGYVFSPARKLHEKQVTQADLMEPPPGFPPSSIKLHSYEARVIASVLQQPEFGSGIPYSERILISKGNCDAIAFKTCAEIEGPFCDYIGEQFGKPVILAGPVVPELSTSTLEEQWAKWIGSFEAKTVIFCSFGSECKLGKQQFRELVLGLELTGMPFFAALKSPLGMEKIENALPVGFEERTHGRGVVHGGWVQQQLILAHPSVGCFVTHCGSGSQMEAMVNECELVLMPQNGDQFINSRLMSRDLEIGVEVERDEEDGFFTREGVCNAIRSVMDVDSEVGKKIRANHAKWRELLSSKSFNSSYINNFIQKLQGLLE